jgi:dynein heavy chain
VFIFFRLNDEYAALQNVALTPPGDTRELVNLKKYISEVKNNVIPEMEERVKVVLSYELFLSDYTILTGVELKQNGKTFQWIEQINVVFAENTKMIEQKTKQLQDLLLSRINKFKIELENYQDQVSEFKQFGNIELLSVYLDKANILDDKLTNALNTIDGFNEEEKHFGWKESSYPLRKTVKLFNFSFK